MKTEWTIRRLQKEDFEEVAELCQLVLEDTFRKEGIEEAVYDLMEELNTKKKYLAMDIDTEGKDRYFLLALNEGKIIGTMEFGRVSPLIVRLTEGVLSDLPELGTAFIHPKYQKKGAASFLLKEMEREMKRRGIREYCLDSGYQRAQKIWRRKFGVPAYTFKNYWGEHAPHMIWRVTLKG